MPNTKPMPVVDTLRNAAKRAREIALHFDRAADELAMDVTPFALDRMENHCCHAHVKASAIKRSATSALRVIAALREGVE